MPFPRLGRPSSRRLCLCTFVTTLLAAIAVFVFTTFYIALPLRRAYYLELDYRKKIGVSPSVQPLVAEREQLFLWTKTAIETDAYDVPLGLNYDGTATDIGISNEAWIYLAGTAPDSTPQPSAYTHKWKKPDCDDRGYICDAYLDAFRRISARWPKSPTYDRNGQTSRPKLRWVDCDISPLLCNPFWGLAGANLLIHMKTSPSCEYSMMPTGSCGVTWRWIGLPMHSCPGVSERRRTNVESHGASGRAGGFEIHARR
jgi:hypothetical protein